MSRAAVEGLGFRRGAGKHIDETKQGLYIYCGEPGKCYEWEFRTKLALMAVEKDNERNIAMSKIVGALRDDAMQVARDIGLDTLMTEK